ncbi:Gfo/Idh/MocA family oxidoreductase [Arthrobacter sp. KNU-44]|uniref:Gfo/Idh/MocA family oxidoreductase n=1 Tax=unclassified Arthrobacter TaxID=235627 RepID=UPI003F442D84
MTAVRWGALTTARIAQDRFLLAMKKARNAAASAVSSPNGRAAEIADRFGVPASYSSHEELLADPNIEAVYLPIPMAFTQSGSSQRQMPARTSCARSRWYAVWMTSGGWRKRANGTR